MARATNTFLEECFPADVIIPADADHVDFCGARFGILQLPGTPPDTSAL